ncbi:D-xylose transport system permease protein [Raineyella antarctica]|uniref:Xylose transport system permease protein XylH n=1 Tax=Raineyella antarctica TaxID=1577474 RepID=A0A1G6GWC7_9ACTN|nr:ABC transporter permease [Raineyella antarctica]SDB86188.1 D-xylose transport system permease protein [Raineyella antarctica]
MSTTKPARTAPGELPPAGPPADLLDERLIAQQGLSGWLRSEGLRLRTGDIGSLPVIIGLVIIWVIFAVLNPAFVSAQNLVNLAIQLVPIGTLALGIVFVLLLGQIDLSAGSVAGVAAAVVAVTFVNMGFPLVLAILAAILSGSLIGLVYGLVFNRFGVPSFIITLAGLLAFLGVQLLVLGNEGTVNVPFNSPLVQFANGTFLPPVVSYVLVVLAAVAVLLSGMQLNRRRASADLSTVPLAVVVVRALFLAAILAAATFVLSQDRGVPLMFVLFVVVIAIMDLTIKRTRWGRDIMAVGGNVEAARRAGINVKAVYLSVFVTCSTFAALGGVLLAARLAAANQSTGTGDVNLNAIAAAVIGGTSLFGGRGSAYSALLGIVVIQSISNGLDLLNLDSSIRFIITGLVTLLAVIIDSTTRRRRAQAGRA